MAQARGNVVKEKAASLLLSIAEDGAVFVKHQAAVLPASSNDTKVMPANAVEEWPDGKDRRPFSISNGSLCHVLNGYMFEQSS